jgi:hypothetical protein
MTPPGYEFELFGKQHDFRAATHDMTGHGRIWNSHCFQTSADFSAGPRPEEVAESRSALYVVVLELNGSPSGLVNYLSSVYCESPLVLHTAYTEAPPSVVRSSAPARPFYVPTGRSAVRVLQEEIQPQRGLLASVVTVAPGGFEDPFLSELLRTGKANCGGCAKTCLVKVGDPSPPAQVTWQ